MNKEEQEVRRKSPVQIRNKKASFEYFFVDTYTAGIVLTGTEIKSIRNGKASLVDSFCVLYKGELWVKGMNISPYFYGSYSNHVAKRDRKLLLTKRELHRLEEDSKQVGFTIVPTLLFIDRHGRAKIDIALARGKKEFDKRQTLREKQDKREMDRALKHFWQLPEVLLAAILFPLSVWIVRWGTPHETLSERVGRENTLITFQFILIPDIQIQWGCMMKRLKECRHSLQNSWLKDW